MGKATIFTFFLKVCCFSKREFQFNVLGAKGNAKVSTRSMKKHMSANANKYFSQTKEYLQ